ncbi:hypothetical protein P170DRAFT_513257 [Aspergillus steynii IBT 23096]|uniref:Hydrolase n=1 Tax=Aspergillus steynii IBT 23096 TaxID=1392250 RepID=A0A2I2FX75_9EURO|nr:uncharacterized protein P170DRAFT_513257 [Aspergillus steynii IBT 23096]PLB45217.1 hypothetical protein P170DRAFT_513257 [Aspergillus steynii IBT 23096]
MSQLADYRLLSFDVYGTLIDWESGVLAAFEPALKKDNAQFSREHLLKTYHELERAQQTMTPHLPYYQLLATVHPQLTERLGLSKPTEEESRIFGESVGHWPAFPDTVEALKRLGKHYKLVVLSNVDRGSFEKTNAGSLQGVHFDLVITAQDVGSYKPDLRNFYHMLQAVKAQFNVEPKQVLQTAQSQFHDHHPARKMEIKSVWIERPGAVMGNLSETVYDWRFDTLGDMADAVEKVAVTFTADQFQGIYRGKRYHEPDFGEVLKRAQEYGCEKVMLTTMTLAGAHENLKVVREFPNVCTLTLGVHPYHAGEIYDGKDGVDHLRAVEELGRTLLAESPSPLVAFGEIGLDYEYLDRADKASQQRAFRDQLELATRMDLPLFLHVRESCSDFIDIIRPYLPRLPRGGLVHSFTGSTEEMHQLVDLGLDISVNGVCFRTEDQLDMVRHIPLKNLHLETDAPWCEVLSNDEKIAPYLASARSLPASRKHNKFVAGQMVKTRNESCTIERVALVVAGLKGISVEEVAQAAWNNSTRMFGLGIHEG